MWVYLSQVVSERAANGQTHQQIRLALWPHHREVDHGSDHDRQHAEHERRQFLSVLLHHAAGDVVDAEYWEEQNHTQPVIPSFCYSTSQHIKAILLLIFTNIKHNVIIFKSNAVFSALKSSFSKDGGLTGCSHAGHFKQEFIGFLLLDDWQVIDIL